VLGDRLEIAQGRFAQALLRERQAERSRIGRRCRRDRSPLLEVGQEIRYEPVDAVRDRPELVG